MIVIELFVFCPADVGENAGVIRFPVREYVAVAVVSYDDVEGTKPVNVPLGVRVNCVGVTASTVQSVKENELGGGGVKLRENVSVPPTGLMPVLLETQTAVLGAPLGQVVAVQFPVPPL